MSRSNIRVVLDEPSHPGNIGAAARAMKTMGLSDLYLVRPERFPDPEADARAVSAVDVVTRATVVDDLRAAIGDCQLVVGVSGRARELSLPALEAREGGQQIMREANAGAPVAVVFGCESTGLTNEALDACTLQLRIPTSPDFKSLNLAAAVQLVCYEIWMGDAAETKSEAPESNRFIETVTETVRTSDAEPEHDRYPSLDEFEYFYQRLERTLAERNFYYPQNPDRVNVKLRRLIARARPKDNELRLLHSLVGLMDFDSAGKRRRS